MKPGFYTTLTNAEYHGGEGVNKGLLDVVERSPLHAKALLDRANDNDRTPTPAQLLGTAFHTLVLEPDVFADEYVCELAQCDAPHAIADRDVLVAMVETLNDGRLPKLSASGDKVTLLARIDAASLEHAERQLPGAAPFDTEKAKVTDLKTAIGQLNDHRAGLLSTSGSMVELRDMIAAETKAAPLVLWSEVRARWASENEGYNVLTVAQYDQLLAMRDAVMAHPGASALLAAPGVAEASVYATDPDTGKLIRCRPDKLRYDGIVVDVKTTEDASPEGFAKSLANWRYHVQDPWYMHVLRLAYDAGHLPPQFAAPKAFVFLAVEKAAPHAVAVYVLDAESRAIGQSQLRKNLDTLAECERTGVWPGYGDGIQQLGVPQYYLNKNLHLIGAA